jgi:predicted acylesterase/phospholipase RssA
MEGARTCQHGLGVCLSGGGFRASFYHIGVLARMAELGMLKHVEVISTVSGGSIVGAAYYLLLKQLLESKTDEVLQDSDYVALVEKLETHFLEAVQKNLRMRTFAHPLKNMRMALPTYSRSDAIGELYEKHIYRPLIKVNDRPIMMSDLYINPKGVPHGVFHPCDEAIGNVTRMHKVPILVLNATSLNTGHNWCFTASWMGEVPPRNPNIRDIDKKDRYRRVRYRDITSRKKDFMLGKAVAASAGVPGLFPPMAVSSLYFNRRVQLVDGGVFDNQGIVGALDPDHLCSDFVVSDASGESDAQDNPDTRLFNVLANASSVLTGRVREEMVNYVEESRAGHVAYFHLTRGLFARDIEYNEQPVINQSQVNKPQGITSSQDEFNVHQDMQRALAHVRTDLDSFTDIEAGCLQADGYQMSDDRLKQLPAKYLATQSFYGNWRFKPFIDKLAANDALTRKHLTIASHKFLKPLFHLLHGTLEPGRSLALAIVSLPLLATLALILYLIDMGLKQLMPYSIWQIVSEQKVFQQFLFDAAPYLYGLLVAFVISALADKIVKGSGKWADRLRNLIKSPMSLITGTLIRVLLPFLIAIPVMLYLATIDRFFVNRIGKGEQTKR